MHIISGFQQKLCCLSAKHSSNLIFCEHFLKVCLHGINSEITYLSQKLRSRPRWHIKDKGHSYYCLKRCLEIRLEKQCILSSRNTIFPHGIFLKFTETTRLDNQWKNLQENVLGVTIWVAFKHSEITMHTAICTLRTAYCILYIAYWVLHTAQCT